MVGRAFGVKSYANMIHKDMQMVVMIEDDRDGVRWSQMIHCGDPKRKCDKRRRRRRYS